ncbi:PAS domain-containing protein [Pontibacter qinzhouensis]|uniref:histidine kinase n=1 Tax=Pontibacter qinzhouensis TaxID=2603253 RepID=A0A5C8KDI4_9BACT|nr:PAS domain-containing protein [Pontibacter qinzhouensis]TXK52659.1 PAS domain-containing protein [Pontibacter qinzhouensis]
MIHASSLPTETLNLLRALPDPYLFIATDFTIITATDAYLQATHQEHDFLTGKPILELFPTNLADLRQSLEWVLENKKPHQLNLQQKVAKDKTEETKDKNWSVTNTPALDAEGQISYLIFKLEAVLQPEESVKSAWQQAKQAVQPSADQTTLSQELIAARAEAELQREQLHNILMQAPALICIFEGPEHVFKLVNPHYQQLVGNRPIQGQPIAKVMPELAGQPIFDLLDKVYRTGETYHAHEMMVQLDHENIGSLGHNYYNFIYQATRDVYGKINGIMVFAYEVTAQVKARQEVEEREYALQTLNEQMAAANEEIRAANEELTVTQMALQELNDVLESRVEERTQELKLAHQKIEADRNRLHVLFMQAATPICILAGEDLVYELVNPAYQQLLPGRRLLGNSMLKEALTELETQPFAQVIKNVYKTGQTYFNQESLVPVARYENGPIENRYFSYTLQARRDEAGQVDGVIVFVFEVTEQVEARQEVEQSAKRLQLITDALPVLIGYLNKEEKYEFANQAYEAWFHKKPSELIGRKVVDIVGEKAYAGVKQYIDRALAGERLDFESRMPYREDFVKYIRTSYVPDVKHGQVEGFFTLVSDITEQVLVRQQIEDREKEANALAQKLLLANEDLSKSNTALQELTQLQKQLVALVDNSIDFIGLATPSGKGVYINQAGLDFLGLEQKQVKELHVTDFFFEEDQAFVQEVIIPALLSEGKWAGEFQFKHFITGEKLPVHYNSFAIKDPDTGQLLGLATISIYIGERKKQEAALKALTEQLANTNAELSTTNEQLTRTNIDLDNFIYTASHDLKAPIFNIEGLMQILIESLPQHLIAAEGLDDVTRMIQQSIERFKRTIDHLTDVTKLQKENNQAMVEVNLAEVIREVRLDLSPQLAEAGAEVTVEMNGCIGVNFSEKNLRSVVYNLLSNAIKYRSPDRKPKVKIECRHEGDYLDLSVQDNGLGIDLEASQRLFTMFGRLHDHVEGSGVGLYMVKKMVENAGGYIEVDSQEGQGSTFKVHLKR